MSGAVVFNQALRHVRGLGLALPAERDFVAALDAARPGPCDLLYELAHEAALTRKELLERASGLYCLFCAGNLADDLIDGECDYLSDAALIGPSVQFGLQHLGYAVLCHAVVGLEHLGAMATELATAGASEHAEVFSSRWTVDEFITVAEGIAGLQWSAYLRVLWAGSRNPDGAELGRAFGIVMHLMEDIRTRDARFCRLSPSDRTSVCRWAEALVGALVRSDSRCLQRVANVAARVFEEEAR